MYRKFVGRMTGRTIFILRGVGHLLGVTGHTPGRRRDHLKIFVSAVALETLDVIKPVAGLIPLLVNLRAYLPVALGTGSQLFLLGKFRMGLTFTLTLLGHGLLLWGGGRLSGATGHQGKPQKDGGG